MATSGDRQSVGRAPARSTRRAVAAWAAILTVVVLAGYALSPEPVRRSFLVAAALVATVPVALVLRWTPRPLRIPWTLVLVGLCISGVGGIVAPIADLGHRPSPPLVYVPVLAQSCFLAAAVVTLIRRGGRDLGGLIDGGLAALAIGGLLWSTVLLPQILAAGESSSTALPLALSVQIVAAMLGLVLSLVETDDTGNPALRLLLLAVALTLAGFVLLGGWPTSTLGVVGGMALLAAYGVVALATLAPGMVRLTAPGRTPPSVGPGRLGLLGLALLTTPVVAGLRILSGQPVRAGVLIGLTTVIVALVMVRIGLLARELHRSQAALRHLAVHDPLTDLLNRRGISEVLTQEIQHQRDFAIVFCDLNAFKAVNDRYGHAAGDWLLVQVADRLRASVRPGDAVCRLGGDEFVLLVRDAGAAEADQVRQRIQAVLREPFQYRSTEIRVSASTGRVISEARDRRAPVTAEHLIDEADAAMYADKTTPRH